MLRGAMAAGAGSIAAFDVDGTLTTRDTFGAFLVRVAGPARVVAAFASNPRAAASAVGRGDRDVLKAAVLADLFAGLAAHKVEALGREHADRIARGWLRADVVSRLRWHQRQRHTVVLVSASLGAYLRPLAEHLGVDHVLCTELEVGPGERLTGRIQGRNCRGPAKVERLAEQFGDGVAVAYAYGNSEGDRELLALAEEAVRVGRRALRPAPTVVRA